MAESQCTWQPKHEQLEQNVGLMRAHSGAKGKLRKRKHKRRPYIGHSKVANGHANVAPRPFIAHQGKEVERKHITQQQNDKKRLPKDLDALAVSYNIDQDVRSPPCAPR
jgi:hypothetical protein